MPIRGLIALLAIVVAPRAAMGQRGGETNCCNGIDDDGDSKIDFNDTDCASNPECPCDREQPFELLFTNGASHLYLQEGIVRRSPLTTRFVIGIRNSTRLRGVQFDAVRTFSMGEHIYEFQGTHRDGLGNPVPRFHLEDDSMVAPHRPNRLATNTRIISVEPGSALQGRAEFLTLDMDPRDIDGFRVQYDAMDAGPSAILPLGHTAPLCVGFEFLLLEVADQANQPFLRGDSDASGSRDLTDAIHILEWLFLRGERPVCDRAADVNDDGRINILDPILLLQWLFVEAPEMPPGPWWRCGGDLTGGALSCRMGCRN